MVSVAPLHHGPLGLPTLFYRILLLPTLHHFWPHHKLLLGVVKGKKHVRSKKAAHRTMQECEENHRDRLCSRRASKSIPSVPLLDEQILTLEGPRLETEPLHCPRREEFPSSSFLGARAMLSLVVETPSRSAAHGMGYPSARRDRPQLRDQLVRQRRTLTVRARPPSARFLKRAPSLLSFPAPQHHPLCFHAR